MSKTIKKNDGMMENLIEKYFEGTLTEAEKVDFDKALNNPYFENELAFHENLRVAIHRKERKALKETLKDIDRNQSITPKRTWLFLKVAATITVIAGLFYITVLRKTQDQSLYLAYYEVYPNVVAPNVRGENGQELKNEAFMAYETENYQEAKKIFLELENQEFASFYIGLCDLELGQPKETILRFSKTKFRDSPYPFETYRKWYLALAYLKIKDTAASKELLKQLVTTDNLQSKKAEELLKKL